MIGRVSLMIPSGEMVTLTPEEEVEVAKEVIRQKVMSSHLRGTRIEGAAIEATGTAVGMAAGAILMGLILGGKFKL